MARSTLKDMRVLPFGLAISLSAFLLFQVQPMIGKYILPWFGGGPAVWTASMLFFQMLLLGGYAYAHQLGVQPPRRQGRLHLLILFAALVWVVWMAFVRETPITPEISLKPAGGIFPVWQVLWVLAVSVGIPYFLLSTTSSLVQVWFRESHQQTSPYAFYALSNGASLLGLISYPFLFEPNWTVRQQANFWSLGFVCYLVLVSICAMLLLRAARQNRRITPVPVEEQISQPLEENEVLKPSARTYLYWVSLAACSSTMLLATTNEITQDIASAPFLWVLPLSLYLLSFVLAFNHLAVRLRKLYALLIPVVLYLGLLNLERGSNLTFLAQIASNAALLLIICLLCHSELYARRPHPRYLTSFYLMVSVGGALGGVFVSLIAPMIFDDFWEYHLGLIFASVLAVIIIYHSEEKWIYWLRIPHMVGILLFTCFILYSPYEWVSGSILMKRNFYGVLRVRPANVDGEPVHNLVHGGILHGSQVITDEGRQRPTRYYTESTGLGLTFLNHRRRLEDQPMRIGVVGLGAGTIAAYGKAGDVIRYYEIDPDIVSIAQDERYFTYLKDTQADVEIVLGDARLSMERELEAGQPQQYDLLVVDAFSGDSIPAHLINRESTAVYLAHLHENGILAFHISNLHIDLEPITALIAEEYGLEAAIIRGGAVDWQGAASNWVLLSRDPRIFWSPAIQLAKRTLGKKPGIRIWTDDYSNLFQLIRR